MKNVLVVLASAAMLAGCAGSSSSSSSSSSSGGGGGSCGANHFIGSGTLPTDIPTFTLATQFTGSACEQSPTEYYLWQVNTGGPFTTADRFTVTTTLTNSETGDSLYVCMGSDGTYSDCDTVHTVTNTTQTDTDMNNSPNDSGADVNTLYILARASRSTANAANALNFNMTVTKE